MKVKVLREMTSGGVDGATEFALSHEDSAHIMTILRDTLYSDRILAVLREYSANAWDSHRMVGKADKPIKVTLPTEAEPKLVIRDFGPGLSQDDVFNVYTKYGRSTKRDTDDAVGMLGIGSKSAFAYADSFTVTSWHGGKKSLYVAVLDASDKGTMNLLHQEDCSPEETGIEIQVAVDQKDISEFEERARYLFKFMLPRPDINMDLPDLPDDTQHLDHGFLYYNSDIGYSDRGWTAVMGCVPYRIDTAKVRDIKPGLPESVHNLSGVLYFDIGDVQINASREELKYSDTTKAAIVAGINNLVDEFVTFHLKKLEGGTAWEQRLGAQVLRRLNMSNVSKRLKSNEIHLRYRGAYDAEDSKKLKAPVTFYISEPTTMKHAYNIHVDENTRLLIADSPRAMAGYRVTRHDRVIRRNKSSTPMADVLEELANHIKALDIDGIPIKKLSELEWHKPYTAGSVYNAKHDKSVFLLVDNPRFVHPMSSDWKVAEGVPTDDDVFVILDRFVATDRLSATIREDKHICNLFKIPVPAVYGYKSTEKKPISASDCKGTPYAAWREKMLKDAAATRTGRRLLELHYAFEANRYAPSRPEHRKRLKMVIETLGEDHPISKGLGVAEKAKKTWLKVNHIHRHIIEILANRLEGGQSVQHERLCERYPLLMKRDDAGLEDLWIGEESHLWLDYIKLIDKMEEITKNIESKEGEEDHGNQDSVHDDSGVDQRCVGREDPHDFTEHGQLLAAS